MRGRIRLGAVGKGGAEREIWVLEGVVGKGQNGFGSLGQYGESRSPRPPGSSEVLQAIIMLGAMRSVLSILLIACCAACHHSRQGSIPGQSRVSRHPRASGSIWTFESRFEGTTYRFEVANEELLGAGAKWNAEAQPLQLTPRQAEQAAIKEAMRLRPEVGAWVMDEISLRSIGGEYWIYEVVLCRADEALTGAPPSEWFIRIPVLLTGAAVHPFPPR